jgi:hypothetical protein
MKSIERRVKALEVEAGVGEPSLSVIIRTGVARGEQGSEDTGPICATIVSGPNKGAWLSREEGEEEAAFLSRIDQAAAGL